jgi:ABC-type Zn uptake system ZnuABC Zn-binding protein ZnuA
MGIAVFLVACAPIQTPVASNKLQVVSTVSPITNIIYNIGGEHIALTGMIPEGSDSHTFEPAPSTAQRFAQADIVFVNGLHLEEPSRNLAAANLKPGAEIVALGEQTVSPDKYVYDFSFPKSEGNPNPHLWMDPMNALRYAEITRDTLARRDPAHAVYYTKNYEAFKARIMALDKAIMESIDSIPPSNRKLLTYHDSFAYFALRYHMTVIGAIQPADFAEPSPREIADLILQIRQEQVPAIFGSEVFPSPILEQIARETGIKFDDSLRDDDLPGLVGETNHSYVGLMVEDVQIITKDLGGDPGPLDKFNTLNVPGSDSAVEQKQ